MKLLDYNGLSRLVTNIKSYIAAKLAPLEDTSPYLLPGVASMQGGVQNGMVADEDIWLYEESYNRWFALTTATATTTAQKEIFDRLMKGFPGILYVKMYTNASQSTYSGYMPLFPVGSYRPNTSVHDVIYRTKDMWFSNGGYLQVSVRRNASQLLIQCSLYEPEESAVEPGYSEFEHMLPCEWTIQSIAADGTVVNAGTKRLPNLTDDVSVALYNRLQKGMPPSVVVDMATSDGETRKVYCYLTKLQATGRTYTYESGVLANGTFTNKCIRVVIQVPTYAVTASCVDATT